MKQTMATDCFAFDPFCCKWTGSNSWATAKRLELGINNSPIVIHFYLHIITNETHSV